MHFYFPVARFLHVHHRCPTDFSLNKKLLFINTCLKGETGTGIWRKDMAQRKKNMHFYFPLLRFLPVHHRCPTDFTLNKKLLFY